MRVSVVGATGLIGRHACEALAARGDEVVAVSRRGDSGMAGVADVRWDPAEGPPPAAALDGADALVNLAGAPLAGRRWSTARKREIRESRVLTTRALVDALAGEGRPRVLVNASGIDYYGPRGEETVDETAGAGTGFLAETCVAWEREAARAADHGVRVVMMRSAVVLSHEGGALPTMARPVRLFAGGPIGGGRQRLPWIHLDDEVGLILFALDRPDLAGPLNATSPEPPRQGEFVKALGRALGRPALVPTPAVALRLALGEMATLVLDGQRAVPRAALAAGYGFRHPDLDGALRAIYG
jgi:uncharacterized protein (TIGR01777 family)